MSNNNVHQVFSGDPTQLEAAYKKLGGALDGHLKLIDKIEARTAAGHQKELDGIKRTTEATKGMGDAAKDAMSSAAAGAASFLGGMLSIGAAISVVNAGLAKQKQLASDAMQSAIQLSAVDAALAGNLDNLDKLGPNAKRAREIMERVGITDTTAFAQGVGFSLAPAFGDPKVGFETLEDVARLTAKTPYELRASAESIGKLRGATNLSRSQARNLLASSAMTTPTASLSDIGTYGLSQVPTAMLMSNMDKHSESEIADQHMALFGTLIAMGLSPEVASTAAASMEGGLKELFSSDADLAKADTGDFEGRWKMLLKSKGGKDKLSKVAQEVYNKLPEELKGKAVSKAIQEGFFQGQGRVPEVYEAQKANVTLDGDVFERKVQGAEHGTFALSTATFEGKSAAAQLVGTANNHRLVTQGSVDTIMERIEGNAYAQGYAQGLIRERDSEAKMNKVGWSRKGGWGSFDYVEQAIENAKNYAGYSAKTDFATGNLVADKEMPLGSFPASERPTIELQRKQLAILEEMLAAMKVGRQAAVMDAMNALR